MDNLKNKRIAFFGTPDFTVDFLELFKKMGINISLVVTGEDKPFGRGLQMKSPGPKVWSTTQAQPLCLQPKKLDEDFLNFLKLEHEKNNFDLFIVVAYGKIIPEKIINLPKYGTINLHYSLLPKYRGASPVESAILSNEKETGLTIQQMVFKLDAGNILYQETIKIEENETANELRSRMNRRALEIFPKFLEDFLSTSPNLPLQKRGVTQDELLATSCGKFSKSDLDVTKDIKEKNLELIFRKFKAFDKKIYFFFENAKKTGEKIRVKITDMNATEILKVLPESKKEISKYDFENSFGKII